MPPKSAAAPSSGAAPRKREAALSTLPPQIAELPITWEDSFGHAGYQVDPPISMPMEPYDEAEQLKAPRGAELHALLEEDAAESAAHAAELSRLQAELTRHTKDTTEMVKYLEAEVSHTASTVATGVVERITLTHNRAVLVAAVSCRCVARI